MKVGSSESFIRKQRSWQYWPQFCVVRMGWNEGAFLSGQELYSVDSAPPPFASFLATSLTYHLLCLWGHFLGWALGSACQHLGKGTWFTDCLAFGGNCGSTMAFFWHLWSSTGSYLLKVVGLRKYCLYMWLRDIWANSRSRKIIPVFPSLFFFFSPKATRKTILSESRRKKPPHSQSCGDP